jgi:hypothetical protein
MPFYRLLAVYSKCSRRGQFFSYEYIAGLLQNCPGRMPDSKRRYISPINSYFINLAFNNLRKTRTSYVAVY